MDEVAVPEPLMRQVSESSGKALGEIARLLRNPASRTGLAMTLGVTALLARARVPFPVTLFIAIVAGEASERMYRNILDMEELTARIRDDAGEADRRG